MAEMEQHGDHLIQMPRPPHPPPLPPQTFPKKSKSAEPREPLWWFRPGVHQILVTVDGKFVAFQNVHDNEPMEQRRMSAFGPNVHQLYITVDVDHKIIASEKRSHYIMPIPGPQQMWAAKPGVHQLLVTLDGEEFVAYQNVYDNQLISGERRISALGQDVHKLLITVDGEDYIADIEMKSGSPLQPMPKWPPQHMPKPRPMSKVKRICMQQMSRVKEAEKPKTPKKPEEPKKPQPMWASPVFSGRVTEAYTSSLFYGAPPSSLSSAWPSAAPSSSGLPPAPPPPLSSPSSFSSSSSSLSNPVLSLPAPPPLPWKRTGLKRPSTFYLWEEQREAYVNICVPLYNAALKGDWQAAEAIINDHREVINMSITKRQDTVLHIVASTKHTHFAQKLVNKMEVEDLELKNRDEETALCVAVASTVEMVDVLLNRNNGLIKIRKNSDLPFMCAIFSGDKDMVRHIYSKTNLVDDNWNYSDKLRILESCITFGLLDIAVEIYNKCKERRIPTIDTRALRSLAYNPSALDGTVRPVIRRFVNKILPRSRTGPLDNSKAAEIVRIMLGEIVKKENILNEISGKPARKNVEGLQFTAARLGNYKFLIEILRLCPDLTWNQDHKKHTIFHIAVEHRQENVYNLLHEIGTKKLGTIDNHGENILHLAARMPAQGRLNIVSGAALQMQRELLWFKEVQTRLNSVDRIKANYRGESPQEIFTEEHADLMEKGEKWLKKTAAQCMVVAALIATMMFAAAFTLPGGNNQNTGNPLLVKKSAFVVFVVTDAIALCTSSASLVMFLAILTARYTENDFLVSLPVKLMVGLLTLFISIANMMIAFSASFFLLYAKSMTWIPVLVSVLASLPVILFAALQYRLLFDVIYTTVNSRHLFRPLKRMLY